MNRSRLLTGVVVLVLLYAASLPTTVSGDDLLDVYIARLCNVDHRNSKGEKLTKVAHIIRQDRANYHKRLHRDEEDEYDSVFGKARNRELLEKWVANGQSTSSARRSILNGTPLIRVKVYSRHVDILIVED